MIAVLKEIVETAVYRPKFDNRRVKVFTHWQIDNEEQLKGYSLALGRSMPDPDSSDNLLEFSRAQKFQSFCLCQYDRETGVYR
jgi:hypothetical protein